MYVSDDGEFSSEREAMLKVIAAYVFFSAEQTQREKLDARVAAALARVPRHEYVPDEVRHVAYEDTPLPIGCGKTISQPFMVALMTELLNIDSTDRVLEIGTGMGYQAAILAELAGQVFTVEIVQELAHEGEKRLRKAGYGNIHFRVGDGASGWAEHGPYDKIVVTAAPELVPTPLLHQLRQNGRMVVPAGIEDQQNLLLVEKDSRGRLSTSEVIPVRFSPLIVSH